MLTPAVTALPRRSLRWLRRWAVAAFLVSLVGTSTSMADNPKKVDWKARVKATTWVLDRDATILDWVRRVDDYDVVMIHKKQGWSDLTIRIEKDGKAIHQWDGHTETPLLVFGDVLYYSQHGPISSGAQLVAVDLKTGKPKWKTSLQGIGPVDHSKYRNQVNIAVGSDAITVWGEESQGSYVELVDPKTGKTLANETRKRAP